MKPTWMIQSNIDGIDTGPLMAEVLRQDMDVVKAEYDFGKCFDFSPYTGQDCIVCYGDISFTGDIHRRAPFVPGVWRNVNSYKCSTYYAHFGELMLNQDCVLLPLAELVRRWDDFVVYPGSELFVRPDSGTKPFTGYVTDRHKIQSLLDSVGPETLVLAAHPQLIFNELRFVICGNKVVAGCQYLPIEDVDYSTLALCLAIKVATHKWSPDLVYTVDIAETPDGFRVLEINSFSCAGLYSCNLEPIVRSISQLALEEWADYRATP